MMQIEKAWRKYMAPCKAMAIDAAKLLADAADSADLSDCGGQAGDANSVAIGSELLHNPNWPRDAAWGLVARTHAQATERFG
jgi:hypothetical protein